MTPVPFVRMNITVVKCNFILLNWQNFKKWLTENQIVLKNKNLSPTTAMGLDSNIIFHKQYFLDL